MPYEGELANKASHVDIVRNPEVAAFLAQCEYLREPTDQEGKELAARYAVPPPTDASLLPEQIIAIDGSRHETNIDDRLPNTRVGYVKVSATLVDMAQFDALRVHGGRFVDPFRVAALQNNNSALTFSLPSANIRWGGKRSVRDSFRAMVDAHFYGEKTRFSEDDPATSLRTTLFHVASLRTGDLGTGSAKRLRLYKCPNCGQGPLELQDVPDQQYCRFCGDEVYPTDCLRLWEEVADFQSNVASLSRFMLLVEHLLPMHYIRYLAERSLASLGQTAFFIDGPLAIFGTAAWLHAAIMRLLDLVNQRLASHNLPNVLIIGLQKTGQVVDHVRLIDKFVPNNRIFAIDDDYRYEHIVPGRQPSSGGFGSETYYGQDFIYKTPTGRTFVLALPYPFASKSSNEISFHQAKADMGRYSNLPRALSVIQHFESDLYENAVIPIALAHRYTAISLVPGGKVLDLFTRRAFEQNR